MELFDYNFCGFPIRTPDLLNILAELWEVVSSFQGSDPDKMEPFLGKKFWRKDEQIRTVRVSWSFQIFHVHPENKWRFQVSSYCLEDVRPCKTRFPIEKCWFCEVIPQKREQMIREDCMTEALGHVFFVCFIYCGINGERRWKKLNTKKMLEIWDDMWWYGMGWYMMIYG